MKRFCLGFSLGLGLAISLFAQVTVDGAGGGGGTGGATGTGTSVSATTAIAGPVGNALIASTTADYPVTPGDTLSLAFLQSTQPTTLRLFVEVDGSVNAGIFGRIEAAGMTYRALKAKIETLVDRGYPGSNPSVQLVATGMFTVEVEGEVAKSELKNAWGLTRLAEIVDASATPFASRRSVLVRNAKGGEQRFDLFLASREGDLSNNPYVKPNDTIVLAKAERVVAVGGAVYRPGSYQLLHGEGMAELIKRYADGLRDEAQPIYASLTRKASSESKAGESIVFDASLPQGAPRPSLLDGDTVFIPTRESYLPVVYFEGAIFSGDALAANMAGAANTANTTSAASAAKPGVADDPNAPHAVSVQQYGRSRYSWKPGDQLSRALRTIVETIQPNADLRNAFIARKGQADTIPVDLERLLHAYDPKDDIFLQPEDRIIIPFGSLDIFVTGEVKKSSWVSAGALTRLSVAIGPFLTPYSSIRDVTVRSSGGQEMSFDLFKADRLGELDQDPFLKPGDLVTVHCLSRKVSITGEVKYPGSYQLLPDEQLKELVEYYAGGFTGKANPARMSLGRDPKPNLPLGQLSQIDYSKDPTHVLRNFDTVVVPPVTEMLPVVYFEGAIGVATTAGAEGKPLDAANKLTHVFVPGETLSQAAQTIRGGFTATSDLANAYLLRDSTKTPVNLADMIYKSDFTHDIALEPNDTVIIPFRQYFVTVAGSVRIPGRYPYVPDRSYEYYINLAGGYDSDKSTGKSFTIDTVDGRKKNPKDSLEPEDRIYVNDDDFIYNFGKVMAIIGNVASVISVAYTVYSLLPK